MNTNTTKTKARLRYRPHAFGETLDRNFDKGFSTSRLPGFGCGEDREPSYPRGFESVTAIAVPETVTPTSIIAAVLALGFVFRRGIVMSKEYVAELGTGCTTKTPDAAKLVTHKAMDYEPLSIADALNRSFHFVKKPMIATARSKVRPAIVNTKPMTLQEEKQLAPKGQVKKPELFNLSCLTRRTRGDVVRKTVTDCVSESGSDTVRSWMIGPYIGDEMRSSLLSDLIGIPRKEIRALPPASRVSVSSEGLRYASSYPQTRIQKMRLTAR